MNPRVLNILDQLEATALEMTVLCKELRETQEAKSTGDMPQADFSMFKDTTQRLLTELWNAPGNTLSHNEIRLDVMFNEDASDSAVRNVITRVRKEMRDCLDCQHEIKTIPKRGYRLERTKTQQNVSKTPRNTPAKRKK